MPFTFSHPAIVLPLARIHPKYISASALIMGSMAPDFEYFIRMRLKQVHGHTLDGIFYFDLPVTLICLCLFHGLVRDTLIDHLPEFLRKKYLPFYQMSWFRYLRQYWYVVIYSAIIGIFSHLFWDAFTHAPGFFVQYIPFLQKDLLLFNVSIPSYDFMQLLSTLAGGLVIIAVILWPHDQKITIHSLKRTLIYVAVVGCIALGVMWLRGVDSQNEFIATSIAGTLIGMMLAPVFLSRRSARQKTISEKNLS